MGLTRELAARFAARGVDYADAPIARTRQAAEDGTLSIMVGASAPVFARIEPILRCCGTEVTHCGAVGSGEVVKLMNNMVVTQTVVALAEALAVGRRAGVDGEVLFQTLAKSSADSFVLRNHGMKSLLPASFPNAPSPPTTCARIWPTRCSSRRRWASRCAAPRPRASCSRKAARPATRTCTFRR